WTYAKYLLGHERTGIAGLGNCRREMGLLKSWARCAQADGRPLIDDVRVRDRIARLDMEIMALEMLLLRVATEARSRSAGLEASILKIRGSELQQEIAALQLDVMGPDAWPYSASWLAGEFDGWTPAPAHAVAATGGYLELRKPTIYGGTNEVQ